AGLDALDQGRAVVIPGLRNKVMATGGRFMPRDWLTRFSGRLLRAASTPSRPPIDVHNQIVAPAAAERVWDLLADVEGWPSWYRACRWVRVEPSGCFRWKAHPIALRSNVVASDRPDSFTFIADARGLHAEHAFTLRPGPDGPGTVVLRALLQAERRYAPVLAGFEAIDQGRRVLADPAASAAARQAACDLIWQGNVELLRHEQRAVVQPNFDRLSFACARLISIGSATSFEVRGVRREVASFTSFYLYSLSRGIPHALRAPAWPRITRFDDRWRWLVTSVVPRFRRIDVDTCLVSASLRRISDEAGHLASAPCVLPRAAVSRRP